MNEDIKNEQLTLAIIDEWRSCSKQYVARTGSDDWISLEEIYRLIIVDLLSKCDLKKLIKTRMDAYLNAWRNPSLWPDVEEGLINISKEFSVSTLSNASADSLNDIFSGTKIKWDAILSAEHCKCFKPHQKVYNMAVNFFGADPSSCLLVASHEYDLNAAKKLGWKTCFINRPFEDSFDYLPKYTDVMQYDFFAHNLMHLYYLISHN